MRKRLFSIVFTLTFAAGFAGAAPFGTAFTYQGRLTDAGGPATGVYDLELRLFDAGVAGSQVGPTLVREDVNVTNGLFTVSLDFGAAPFSGDERWLGIGVRPGASTGSFTALSPLQELTPAPNALFASSAGAVDWAGVANKPAGFADGVDNAGTGTVTSVTGAAPLAGTVTTSGALSLTTCAANLIYKMNAGGTAWACAADIDTNTTYSAGVGSGLVLAGTIFGTDPSVVARKDSAAGSQTFDANTLYLDYANNRVGVLTGLPAVPLDVNGTTRSTAFTYSAPKASAYRVAGVNFVPDQGAITVEYLSSGYLIYTGTTTTAQLYAPVHIPDGATITGATCDVFDNDVTNNMTGLYLYLYRRATGFLGSTVHGATFGPTTGTNPAIVTKTTTVSHVVDAESYDYYMLFIMAVDAASPNLRFFGCSLNYTMPGPAY